MILLYVEDEDMVRNQLARILGRRADSILIAENGKVGLELYKQHSEEISMIVSDIRMPVMDGMTMCKEIRKEAPKLPIIIVSAFIEDDDKKKLNGNTKYIPKPIDITSLITTVDMIKQQQEG